MNQGNLSRRGFLQRSLGAMVGAGLPLWYANETLEHNQAEASAAQGDRLVMGAIGVGTNYLRRGGGPVRGERGIAIMQDAMRQPGVTMIGVCDVDAHNKGFAANLVGRGCTQYDDYRRLLENRDIQAVTIGTPDHWHAIIAIAAMRAGKDVYCEKPLTLTLEEGKAVARVARTTNKILQTGSQQRSDARFRLACELVRNGRIGRIQRVTTLIGSNPTGGPFAVEAVPAGLNWDFWLGPTPRVEYVKQRCHYEFRWWYEYSGGKMTDWGAHHNDIAQWALGMDESGPTSVSGSGERPDARAHCYNCHPNFEAVYTYASGARLICRSNPPKGWRHANNGVLFEGENDQWIFVNRGSITASAQRLLDDPLGRDATRLEVSTNHMANFMSAVRTRRAPICHAGVGHRSCSVCHIGNIAIRLGRGADRPLRWDPREERFTGEEAEANAMLSRTMRGPWRLEA